MKKFFLFWAALGVTVIVAVLVRFTQREAITPGMDRVLEAEASVAAPARQPPPVPVGPPPGKILAHWSFDRESVDGDQVRDQGPGGHHGYIRSQNTIRPGLVTGIRGEALDFPRGHESWVEINSPPELNPPFTLTVWVRLTARQGMMEILGQKAHTWTEGIRLGFSLRRLAFEYSDGRERITLLHESHQTSGNQWVFLAVVHDGEAIALYVDGWEVIREPSHPVRSSRRPMLLGNYVIHKDKYRLVGQLDEVFLFDEALSPRQLMDLGLWAQGREKTMD